MNINLILILCFSAISGLLAVTRHFQMLQLNSYYPSRYFKWLKGNFNNGFLLCAVLYLIVSLMYFLKLYIVGCIVSLFIVFYNIKTSTELQKRSIKKLVFTSRVKRLYLAGILLFALLILLAVLTKAGFLNRLFISAVLLLSYVTPLLTYALWGIMVPVEKRIARYYVDDAKKILASMPNLKVIGITGSYGKTTTKFILTRILSEKFNVVCTPQSFNTPMGIVRTVRTMLKPQTEIFVCEMGAKQIGDIKEDCDIANPHYGIITSVGPQHLETFKTVDNVFATKFELADAVKQNGGLTFVNGDSKEISSRIGSEFKVYGTDKSFDFYGEELSYGRNGSQFTVTLDGKKVPFKSEAKRS